MYRMNSITQQINGGIQNLEVEAMNAKSDFLKTVNENVSKLQEAGKSLGTATEAIFGAEALSNQMIKCHRC